MGMKIGRHVLMPELPVGMILEAGQNHRSAGGAACRGAAGLREFDGRLGEFIEPWCGLVRVSIGPELQSKVVGYDQDHVFVRLGGVETLVVQRMGCQQGERHQNAI